MEALHPLADLPAGLSPSWRALPRLIAGGVALVRRAAPREFALSVALRVVNGIALGALLVVGERALRAILSGATAGASLSGLLLPVLALAALTVLVSALGALTGALEDVLGALVARHAHERVLGVACAAELEAYDSPDFHDRLERATLGAHLRPLELVNGLLTLAGALAGLVAIGAVLVSLELWLLPLALAAAVPLLLAAARAGNVQFGFTYVMTPADRERAYLFDLLTGRPAAAEVRAFGLGGLLRPRHAALYDQHIAGLRQAARRRLSLTLQGAAASAFITGATISLVLWLAASGRMPLAEAGVALGSVVLISQRLSAVVAGAGQLYESARFVDDMWSFLAPERPSPATAGAAPTTFSSLRVEDVSFTYPQAARPALRAVSLEIAAGEVIALVGENGSGKTTLAKLLARLYLPTEGRILWDGVDISQLDAEALRRSVAVVFQDYLRYALTARENIGAGDCQRIGQHDAIARAARQAGIDAALRALPRGYETLLAPEWEGGADLSLGQWQRVALARAFFRDAPFVVLDEPTAALDPRAEHALLERIRGLFADRSVLVISHRLASVRAADRIYVLDRGEIVECGTHDDLVREGGRYAELYALQAAAYALEAEAA
jgi:ATP-binding cassette subfamily B protein